MLLADNDLDQLLNLAQFLQLVEKSLLDRLEHFLSFLLFDSFSALKHICDLHLDQILEQFCKALVSIHILRLLWFLHFLQKADHRLRQGTLTPAVVAL